MIYYEKRITPSVDLGENCRFNYGGWCLNIFKGCTSLTDITCRSLEAREFREPMFDESTYTTATLHVPSPSVDAYMATNYWYKFTNVQVYADEVMLSSALNIEGGIIHFVSNGDYPWVVVTEGDRTFAQSTNAGQATENRLTDNPSPIALVNQGTEIFLKTFLYLCSPEHKIYLFYVKNRSRIRRRDAAGQPGHTI